MDACEVRWTWALTSLVLPVDPQLLRGIQERVQPGGACIGARRRHAISRPPQPWPPEPGPTTSRDVQPAYFLFRQRHSRQRPLAIAWIAGSENAQVAHAGPHRHGKLCIK